MSDVNVKQSDAPGQYLTFMLDGEEYGVPILKVNGIQGWEKATPVPAMPDYVRGIINLRGAVVPIIDLRTRFLLDRVVHDSHTVVIVVSVGESEKKRTVGLVVDAVADVRNIDSEQIHDAPDFGGCVTDAFVTGLGMINEKMIILLDIDNLIDWSRVAAEDRFPEHAGGTLAA